MKYRLVLQWPTRWSWSFSRPISVEEKLERELGNLGVVDGHDMGSEMSIFVDTDDPKTAFERALVIHDWWKRRNLKAGYRDFEGRRAHANLHPGIGSFLRNMRLYVLRRHRM